MPKIDMKAPDATKLVRKTLFVTGDGVTFIESRPILIAENGVIVNDPLRECTYEGQAFFNNHPFTFKILAAKDLGDACARFPAALQFAVDEMEANQKRVQPVPGMVGRIVDPSRRTR